MTILRNDGECLSAIRSSQTITTLASLVEAFIYAQALSVAIQNWREELAAQSNLTEEMRRELETHLNDTVAELQRRGLNDEESFWLARRRVGQPKELAEEFGKAAPAKAYREGVLWIALAFFAMSLWQNLANGFRVVITLQNVWVNQVIISLTYLPVAWLAVAMARGRFLEKLVAWRFLIRSRGRFVVVACFSFLATRSFQVAMQLEMLKARGASMGDLSWGGSFWAIWTSMLSLGILIWPVVLIAIIVWLLPAEESRTLKRT